ncbi:hypothetical protein H2198_003235 [Neophaeococcomyces mojaviensis]|uniref:Uncharacterized protein n=1 Tax=Neophaeococcomyces mojaviensis TaxID=3383035 RepID=A0ACC3ABU7_9EURO|nr:hypothetical protein H2198_003235 [Knufia sp. JES_112]
MDALSTSTTTSMDGDTTRNRSPLDEITEESDTEESSSDDSDDSTDSDDSDNILNDASIVRSYDARIAIAYHRLASRRVDLVGDYAGNELFLIEGDSLLLRCFDDKKLDFNPGFQMLHAAYNVEVFLHNLTKRKCNFNLIFFNSNKDLCVPEAVSIPHRSKYLLVRAAIIRHLRVNLPKTLHNIKIDVFASWSSPEFTEYLDNISPYFLMAHDGAHSTSINAKHLAEDSPALSPNQVRLRGMILSLAARGYNIALLNELEWHDTKVMTMVLEAKYRESGKRIFLDGKQHPQSAAVLVASSELEFLHSEFSSLSERQQLAVISVNTMLKAVPPQITAQMWMKLCAAFLLHQALLESLPLTIRRVDGCAGSHLTMRFIDTLAKIAASLLYSPSWNTTNSSLSGVCNVVDFVDGRLFHNVVAERVSIGSLAFAKFKELGAAVAALSSNDISLEDELGMQPSSKTHFFSSPDSGKILPDEVAVLPFQNRIFDKHLERIRIQVDQDGSSAQSITAGKIFKELSHWHNARKPLVQRAAAVAKDPKRAAWALRSNQRFMAEIRTYAASLTNAVGKSLDPETIIVGASEKDRKSTAEADRQQDMVAAKNPLTQRKGKLAGKKNKGNNGPQRTDKQEMLHQIDIQKHQKAVEAREKVMKAWKKVCDGYSTEKDPVGRYRMAEKYLSGLPSASRAIVCNECELYMLMCLIQHLANVSQSEERAYPAYIVANVWHHVLKLSRQPALSTTIIKCLESVVEAVGLPMVSHQIEDTEDNELAFLFSIPPKQQLAGLHMPFVDFQLLNCGPYMERSFDAKPDPRVQFHPDDWQRRVLDCIDRDESVFVVAPTSAGKTFISFYAMRKILESDDDGVLVYVAPTKALVNQIAAEIQARYTKKFKHAGGKSVWAIHTRDYRINNPTGCQVLVTVPHILQIMLLAPSNANSWSSRVRRIIFDEVHSIGHAEDGVVWEQLLLMAPCPIIALSATVGNPEEFSDWLAAAQQAIGKKLVIVRHPHRYSDLRKYHYVPPKQFLFAGLASHVSFGHLDLDGLPGLNPVHPVAALVDRTRGIPEDLALEPRDCFTLWKAMIKVQNEQYPIPKDLDPSKALPEVPRKVDILKWESGLIELLGNWLKDSRSPYDLLLQEIEKTFRDDMNDGKAFSSTTTKSSTKTEDIGNTQNFLKSTMSLLCSLHQRDALPAIIFNYDRHQCEKICKAVTQQLKLAEIQQHKSGPKWERKLEDWEKWKKLKARAYLKESKFKEKEVKRPKDRDGDAEKVSRTDRLQETGSGADDPWIHFDPAAPLDGYHFTDKTKLEQRELQEMTRTLQYRGIEPWLLQALERGVGVHHAGMNRKYRQVVEILFRKRFLRVVIATGTLALGINMPCKTVVFAGDSVYLTALNYRQCAGRAGRRGFDLLGNVVFQDISRQKVCRLMSSRLPDLNGHFPITTTLVLRLFILLHESKNSPYAVSAINSLLSQPRLYMGGESFKDQTMHHLRFSIEYLRRQALLGGDGTPLNFAGLVSHLYFTENSAFAFHALLKEGYFHQLCADIDTKEKDTLETLMLVLSHLFNRIQCRQSDAEFQEKTVKPSSSMVFLPPLPTQASKILYEHNQQTLHVYKAYVKTFVDQHITYDDNTLPLTGMKAGANADAADTINSLPQTRIRSSFVALSGAGDEFESIQDLCSTTRSGVFLEEAVIPYMQVSRDDDDEIPLNAWLLDFFRHGDVKTLERANGIRRSDIWFYLNDFSLVLATIITSLQNFLKLSAGSDMDMLDVQGSMDARELAKEESLLPEESVSEVDSGLGIDEQGVTSTTEVPTGKPSGRSVSSVADSGISMASAPKRIVKPKKSKLKDSWDDSDSGEEVEVTQKTDDATLEDELNGWTMGDGEGLQNVLKTFLRLQAEFDVKFKAMWA